MNKWLFTTAVLIAITPQAYSCPFNGFYLGPELGVINREVKNHINESYTSNNPDDLGTVNFIDETKKDHQTDWLLGAYAGLGRTFNCFYLGAEVSAVADFSQTDETHAYTGSDDLTYYFKHRFERDIAFGIAPRVGYILNNCWMVYVKPGIEISEYTIEHFAPETTTADDITYTGSPLFRRDKTKVTFVPSIGIEKQICRLIARVEYGYDFGANLDQHVNYSQFGITDEDIFDYNTTDHQHLKFSGQFIKIGLAYQF